MTGAVVVQLGGELYAYNTVGTSWMQDINTVLSNTPAGTQASYMNGSQSGTITSADVSSAPEAAATGDTTGQDANAEAGTGGTVMVGGQVGPAVVNPDGSVTYTFMYANGQTETYTVPAGSVSSAGGGDGGSGCTTQDNSNKSQKTRRHNAKDTESNGSC
jgi:hypothetical protein